MTAYSDKFAFLPYPLKVQFSGGSIATLPQFDKALTAVADHMHPDGHIYPPITYRVTQQLVSGEGLQDAEKVPQSNRPALMHQLPATHCLQIDQTFPTQEEARYGEAGFVMHLLGFLYGQRCHFHDWWLDGRVYVKGDIDYATPRSEKLGGILSNALATWRKMHPPHRLIAINILYLHSRTRVYELDWERFANEFQPFDATYRLARHTGKLPEPPNRRRVRYDGRIIHLCQHFQIPVDLPKVQKIVTLRNKLVHELVWDDRMPGEARSNDSFYAAYWLHKLTKRAMLAVLGLKGQYIQTPWWSLGQYGFDIS